MPPHCDTLNGPVVLAAKKALETGNVNWILPWIYEGGEKAVRDAFEKTIKIRNQCQKEVKDLAEFWFYETAVRIHREGEGAAYTGLKPASDVGPVLTKVDEGIEHDSPEDLIHFLQHTLEHVIKEKFEHVHHSKKYDINDVPAARKYVQAYLGLALFSHHLYETLTSDINHGEVEQKAGEKDQKKSGEHGHHH